MFDQISKQSEQILFVLFSKQSKLARKLKKKHNEHFCQIWQTAFKSFKILNLYILIQELFLGSGRSVRIQNDIEIGPILQQQAAVGNTGLEERERINPTIEHEHY